MSDEIKKTDADESVDAEENTKPVKKRSVSKKKVKATENSISDGKKEKIIDKLQTMGVMSGKKTDAVENNNSGTRDFLKISIAVVLAIGLVGSFVWALNNEAANKSIASSNNDHVALSAYPGSYNNNRKYNPNDYNQQAQRVQQQQEQQKKWMQQQQQQQQQAQEQQQWLQAEEQRRAQYQKWAQQRPTQEQYRNQQKKWAQQRQQDQEQQYAQQQKWAQQQPNNAYPPRIDYQRQPAPMFYNNVPRYQQPSPYYGPQY